MVLVVFNILEDLGKFSIQFTLFIFINDVLLHLMVQETSRNANINSCFHLVTSQDPQFDAYRFHKLYRIGNFVLQPVLNSSRPNQLKFDLNFLIHRCNSLFSIL